MALLATLETSAGQGAEWTNLNGMELEYEGTPLKDRLAQRPSDRELHRL